MNRKFNLIVCELYHPAIHGKDENSDLNIETHYLVYGIYDAISGLSLDLDNEPDDNSADAEINYINDDNINDDINDAMLFLNNVVYNIRFYPPHPTIRNYRYIVSRPNYIKPEIAQYIILPTQEAIAILKTFWLRIIQKKWKKIFKERKHVINKRCCLSSLYYRQVNGRWPSNCDYLPGLKGMFYSNIITE